MKVAFLVDYYVPFTPGGSEWSVYYLAKQLNLKNTEAVIVTPNYGAKAQEVIDGVEVMRFPIMTKPKDNRSVINPIWQNNPLFFIWSGYWIYQTLRRQNCDVLHVHGKYLIPGAWIATRLLGKPFFVTIRDKQLLCNYGYCFFAENRYQACNFWEYLTQDLPWYFKNYVKPKNISTLFFTILSGIYTRMASHLIATFAKRADKVLTISKSQKKYMEVNGFKNVQVIYNSVIFTKLPKNTNKKGILFAGKLSRGKGVYLLLEAIPEVVKKYQEIFLFAGGVEEKNQINKVIRKLRISKNVKLIGGVDHHKLQRLYQQCKLVVMPSIFPEAFGRIALEGLAAGTPVVVVDKGGLPEIIEPGITGEMSKLNAEDLSAKIIKVLKGHKKYLINISKKRLELQKKFEVEPVNQHIKLYKEYAK